MKKFTKSGLKNGLLMLVSCFLIAFASNCILNPAGLSTSGITGLSIVLQHVTGMNYTYIYYIFAIGILLITLLTMGKKEVGKIVLLSMLYPTMMLVLQTFQIEINFTDPILAVISFAILYGVGVGIAFKLSYSYGGTDTLGRIMHKKIFPFVSVATILLVIDGLILLVTVFVLGVDIMLYGLISQIIITKVIDYVMFGIGTTLYKHEIISEKYLEISEYIMRKIGRGATLTVIVGAYTNTERVQLSCVCSPKQSIYIKKFIAELDDKAYVEVMPIVAVWGVGERFKQISD